MRHSIIFEKLKKFTRNHKWFGYEWFSYCSIHRENNKDCNICQVGSWSKRRKTWDERKKGKKTDIIPKGDYCYVYTGKNSIGDDGLPRHGVKYCPYYRHKKFHGVVHPYCDFLEMGDFGNDNIDARQHNRLVRVFGSEDALFDSDEFKLFLLWDGIKECGENKLEDACCDPLTCIHREVAKE